MPTWPREKLLPHPPELPMAERVRRYQHNIRTIREAGCTVPTFAIPDTLDPQEIEAWFRKCDARIAGLRRLIGELSRLPDDTQVPFATLH